METLCFLHNMEELCNLPEVLWRKHGKYGDYMKTVWRVIPFKRIYGLEIVCGFHGENMVNQLKQSSY